MKKKEIRCLSVEEIGASGRRGKEGDEEGSDGGKKRGGTRGGGDGGAVRQSNIFNFFCC